MSTASLPTKLGSPRRFNLKLGGSNKATVGFLFLLPFLVFFFLFNVFPVFYSLFLSFQEWNGFGTMAQVGFQHYVQLLQDGRFLNGVFNTFYLLIINVPLMVFLALVGAVVLNSRKAPMPSFFTSVFFFPYLIPLVVVGAIFGMLLDTEYGMVNYVLGFAGLPNIPWLDSTSWSKNALILALVWRWVGYWMIICLAGLQNINTQLYDAARIDGAGSVRMFTRITVPLMRPVLLFVVLMNSIGTLKAFATPFMLTRGDPILSSETIVMYIYRMAFVHLRLGSAAAATWLMFIIIFIFSMVQLRVGRER